MLAGGQSLVPLLSLRLARPAHLIDVNGASELSGIDTSFGLRLGATVRHRTAERSPAVAAANPLLSRSIRFIGHAAIRNRGTIGGSIAHADPAAELPTVLLALDGEVEARRPSLIRTIAAEDFFLGFLTTALEPDELLTSVNLPSWQDRTGWSFQEFSRRNGDFAVAAAAAVLRLDDQGRVAHARLALAGMGPAPTRAKAAEHSLLGQTPSAELWLEAARSAVTELDPPSDVHGTAAYRSHLATVLAARSLDEAHQRAREAA